MTYCFGDYELDPALRELRRAGEPVELEPKAFDLLLYLVRNRERAVGKDELQAELWPRMIVTDTALTRCVMKARRAVGDDSDAQAVIRTLHGHGYRFVADVGGPAVQAPAGPDNVVTTARRRGRRWLRGGLLAAALAVGIAGSFVAFRPAGPGGGKLAVLPVEVAIEDDAHAWARLGLMSLLGRMLTDAGIDVAAERAVVAALGETPAAGTLAAEPAARVRLRAGADTLLATRLYREGGLYRLAAEVGWPDGRRSRRVIVGDSPAALAADLAAVVAGLVAAAEPRAVARLRRVSTDPFVNELYARALDLELQGDYAAARNMFEVAAAEEPALFWLRYEIALCTRLLREWDTARAQLDGLLAEARAAGDAEAITATLNAIGVTEFSQNRYAAARPYYREALEQAAGPAFAADRAAIHVNLALIAQRLGEPASAREHYEQALAAHAEAGEEPAPTLYNNFAGLLLGDGDFARAQDYAERAVERFRVLGYRQFEAPALNRLAKIARARGDTARALTLHEQARALYVDIGDPGGALSVAIAMTPLYVENGDLTRARLNADDTLARAMAGDDRLLVAEALLESARAAVAAGDHATALRQFAAARDEYLALDYVPARQAAERGLALALASSGELARAAELIARLGDEARRANDPNAVVEAGFLDAALAIAQGNAAQGTALLERVLEQARGAQNDDLRERAAGLLVDNYLDAGRLADAAELLEELGPTAGKRLDWLRRAAKLAVAQGDAARARLLLTDLRSRAGEAWQTADAVLLESLDPAPARP